MASAAALFHFGLSCAFEQLCKTWLNWIWATHLACALVIVAALVVVVVVIVVVAVVEVIDARVAAFKNQYFALV